MPRKKNQGIWTCALQHPPPVPHLSASSKSGCFPLTVLLRRSKLGYRTNGQQQIKRPIRCCSKSCQLNQSLRSSGDKSVAGRTLRLAYGWYHRECSTRTRQGQQGKSFHSAAADATACDCSFYRTKLSPRSRWKRRATAMTLGSRATTLSRTKG